MTDERDNTPLAVGVIVFTVLALSLGDALIKQTSAGFVLWQIFVLRSLLALPVLLAVIRLRFPDVPLMPLALAWTALRSVMLTAMWIVYYTALPHLELSVAAAAYYTLPIFITLFSALFVGERVSRMGWMAVALGFFGVVLILRPTASDFSAYALLPLISAVLYAWAMILTRTRCRAEHPLVLAIMLNLSFVAVGLTATIFLSGSGESFLLGPWTTLAGPETVAIVLMAIAILIGSLGTAIAYQIGRPSVVSTFDFAYVGFAAIWGFVFFSEVPDVVTLSGIILIVVAGVIAVRSG